MGKNDEKNKTNDQIAAEQSRQKKTYDPLEKSLSNNYEASRAGLGRYQWLYDDIIDNGGFSPEALESIRGSIGGLQKIGKYGALDKESQTRVRGNGVFDEFAKTGGYSAKDISNIRDRTASSVPAFYGSLKDELTRRDTVAGGGNVGFSNQMGKLAREQARGTRDAVLDSEIGIKEKVNEGRQWGAGSLSDAEKSLIANALAGNSAAGGMEMNLSNSQTQNRLGAAGQSRADEFADLDALLKVLGMRGDGAARGIDQRINNNQKQGGGWVDTAAGIAGLGLAGWGAYNDYNKNKNKNPNNFGKVGNLSGGGFGTGTTGGTWGGGTWGGGRF